MSELKLLKKRAHQAVYLVDVALAQLGLAEPYGVTLLPTLFDNEMQIALKHRGRAVAVKSGMLDKDTAPTMEWAADVAARLKAAYEGV